MCRCEGYGFQAVYSRIEYMNTVEPPVSKPPIMSRICGRLREVVAYQRSDHRGSKFCCNLHMVIAET